MWWIDGRPVRDRTSDSTLSNPDSARNTDDTVLLNQGTCRTRQG
jgi:hypothetical protein